MRVKRWLRRRDSSRPPEIPRQSGCGPGSGSMTLLKPAALPQPDERRLMRAGHGQTAICACAWLSKKRRGRDLNPRRTDGPKRFSRPPHSTTLPPLRRTKSSAASLSVFWRQGGLGARLRRRERSRPGKRETEKEGLEPSKEE